MGLRVRQLPLTCLDHAVSLTLAVRSQSARRLCRCLGGYLWGATSDDRKRRVCTPAQQPIARESSARKTVGPSWHEPRSQAPARGSNAVRFAWQKNACTVKGNA
eukprot:3992491-Pleurochrysis_carterae.AAC.1